MRFLRLIAGAFIFLGALTMFANTAFAGGRSPVGGLCYQLVAPKPRPSVEFAQKISGVVVGSFNDIIITATNVSVLPPQLAVWMPFFNETANVLATSTGREAIYSGLNKRVIDGIALGAMTGQAATVAFEKGPLEGLLTLGISVGLTYWFPNKYFKPILRGIPGYLPRPIRGPAASGPGQGVIGVSLIYVLEQLMVHGHRLVQ